MCYIRKSSTGLDCKVFAVPREDDLLTLESIMMYTLFFSFNLLTFQILISKAMIIFLPNHGLLSSDSLCLQILIASSQCAVKIHCR